MNGESLPTNLYIRCTECEKIFNVSTKDRQPIEEELAVALVLADRIYKNLIGIPCVCGVCRDAALGITHG